MFIIAFSLLTIAVVLVLFLVRRWRGAAAEPYLAIDRPLAVTFARLPAVFRFHALAQTDIA
jgi:hypothetical protein